MSVGEVYEVVVAGPDDGLSIAARLASKSLAVPRWAALWSSPPLRPELLTQLATRRVTPTSIDGLELEMFCVADPTIEEIRQLVANAGDNPLCIHWSSRLYTSDAGLDAPWISFVDNLGYTREDAVIYAFELASNAVPLTTPADRATDADLAFGPQSSVGWKLRIDDVRDHMPIAQFVEWLSNAMCVPVSSITRL